MGDASHLRRRSDHNLGNAIDVTHDPRNGVDAGSLGEEWRRQMSGYPDGRITYLIFHGRIASARTAWAWSSYTGRNNHATHLHMSVRADRRAVTRPWSF
jgi:hypothetical protein